MKLTHLLACSSLALSLCAGAHAAELKVYFGNLHSHTSYSDGSGTPSQAYRYARDEAHLDFLAITEHNHKKAEQGIAAGDPRKDGVLIAKTPSLYNGSQSSSLKSAATQYTRSNVFVALYGQEFSTISSGNHVNVFEEPDVIADATVTNGNFKLLAAWLETHPDSQFLPPVIQFNHPSSQYRNESTEYGMDDFGTSAEWFTQMSKYARLIEVLNGPGTINQPNLTPDVTEADYLYYLNAGFKLAPTGDQDNHFKNWGNSTQARTGVIADALTKPKILEALRNRHTYATEDRNLRIIFFVNGHLCGDIINTPPAVGAELDIKYSLVDDDETDSDYRIEVYSDLPGGNVATILDSVTTSDNTPAGTLRSIEDIHYTGGHQYLFFKITQLAEHGHADRAWTAPVWFEAGAAAIVVAGGGGDSAADANLVASKNSDLYHLSIACQSAANIKPQNLLTGPSVKSGRTLHPNCPL